MTKLNTSERNALNNTCARLKETKLGTHIGNIDDFLNIDSLDTEADDVRNAINELVDLIKKNPAQNVQIRNGYFTLWANDDGDLYCCSNSEDYPPTFTHDETTGDLFVNFATKDDPYGAQFKVANFIPLKKLDDYYKKTETYSQNEINTKLNDKSDTNHNHDSIYSKLGHNHDTVYSKLSHNHDTVYSKTGHTHDDRYYTETEIDSKIAQISSDVEVDLESYAKKTDLNSINGDISSINSKINGITFNRTGETLRSGGTLSILYFGGTLIITFTNVTVSQTMNIVHQNTALTGWLQNKKTTIEWRVVVGSNIGTLKYDGAMEEFSYSGTAGKLNCTVIL